MRKLLTYILFLFLFCSCSGSDVKDSGDDIIIEKMVEQVALPSSVSVEAGSSYRVAGKGFEGGDLLLFESGNVSFSIPLENISYAEASFVFTEDFVTGTVYDVFLERGNRRQRLGKMTVYLKDPVLKENISGAVTCGGSPVSGVWVTDGYVWCKTGADGKYSLLSGKKAGYVYIVTPSGYEVQRNDAFPPFWQALSSPDSSIPEVHDFSLVRRNNDVHTVLFSADWHLRNEWNPKDIVQIQDYMHEADAYAKASPCPVYAIPLGDISWEISWYDHHFDLSDWKKLVASSSMPVFPVIGNHDHDFKASGANSDFDAAGPWRRIMGPNYYSMDIGKVHYLFVDNVLYHSDGTGNVRETEETIPDYQLDWIRQDLSHVSSDTPVVVSLHVPTHGWSWNGYFWNGLNRGVNYSELRDMLERFSQVCINSGHSHTSEFFDAKSLGLSSTNMTERKLPAIGGSIWRTRTIRDYTITIDGVPGGYDIFEANGTSLRWRFKPVGHDISYQVRAYDMNSVKSYWQTIPAAVSLAAAKPEYSFDAMWGSLPENTVLLNVFAGDPRMDGMTIEVYEGSTALKVKPWNGRDPLHMLAIEVAYWGSVGALPSGTTYLTAAANTHLFAVTASSPSSELVIKLKDRFDNKYEYSVKLPKQLKDEDSF